MKIMMMRWRSRSNCFSSASRELPQKRNERRVRKISDVSIFPWAHSSRKSHHKGQHTLLRAGLMIGVILDFSASLDDVATDVEDEVVIESGLHVSGAAAASCYAKYGNPFTHAAPPLGIDWVDDEEVLGPSKGETLKEKMTDEETDLAVCLATPMELNDDSADVRVREKLKDLARELQGVEEEDDDIVEELEKVEEAAVMRGSNVTRFRRRRGDEWVTEQEGMTQWAGMDEISNICSIYLDESHNSLIRSEPLRDPAVKEINGDLDASDT